jgi:DNA polymerase
MYSACVQEYAQWREVARPLLSTGIEPELVEWRAGTTFERCTEMPASTPLRLSRQLIELLESAACYRHAGRWELM